MPTKPWTGKSEIGAVISVAAIGRFGLARLMALERRIRWLLLGLIVLAAGVLRFAYYGTASGQPDEVITSEVVRYMRTSGNWDTNWAKADLPAELKYDQYNFSSSIYATFGFYRLVKLLPWTEEWRAEGGGFLVYRFLSALLSLAAVILSMYLAYRLDGFAAALIVGVLVAASTILVQDAHYVRPEPFVTLLTLGAVTLAIPADSPNRIRPLCSALLVGLLIACKVSMLLVAWLPLVPILGGTVAGKKRLFLAGGAVVAIGLGFLLGAPGALTNVAAFANGVRRLAEQYSGLHPPHSHVTPSAAADMLVAYFAATLGIPALVAAGAGLVILVRLRRWPELLLIAGPVVLFAGYFATRSVFFERNLSHVVPLFYILVAVGVVRLSRLLPATATARGILLFACCGLLATRPIVLTSRLVAVALSGGEADLHTRFEQELRGRFPGRELAAEALLVDEPLNRLASKVPADGRGLLLGVPDYQDEWTAVGLSHLRERFRIEPVADYPGIFPGIPTSTLLTYHSTEEHYFLVSGPR